MLPRTSQSLPSYHAHRYLHCLYNSRKSNKAHLRNHCWQYRFRHIKLRESTLRHSSILIGIQNHSHNGHMTASSPCSILNPVHTCPYCSKRSIHHNQCYRHKLTLFDQVCYWNPVNRFSFEETWTRWGKLGSLLAKMLIHLIQYLIGIKRRLLGRTSPALSWCLWEAM